MNAYRFFAPVLLLLSCGVEPGPAGPAGPAGPVGPVGPISMEIITARLQPHYVSGADGSRLPTGGIWDSQRKEACAYRRTEDNVTRCIPSGEMAVEWAGLYADSSCTNRAWASNCLPKYGLIIQNASGCGNGWQIFTLEEAHPSGVYRRDENNACVRASGVQQRIMTLTAIVNATEFVALKE